MKGERRIAWRLREIDPPQAMAVCGGPERRIHAMPGCTALSSLLWARLDGAVGRALSVWAVAGFFLLFLLPIINWSSQGIWQAKVSPDGQGRVFAVRRLICQITGPLAILLTVPQIHPLPIPGPQVRSS